VQASLCGTPVLEVEIAVCRSAVSAWGLNGLAKTAQETSYTRSAVTRVGSCSWRRRRETGTSTADNRCPVTHRLKWGQCLAELARYWYTDVSINCTH